MLSSFDGLAAHVRTGSPEDVLHKRKSWLFIGSDDGAEANAVFVSLLASCRMHNVEPWAYLRDLCCLLPTWSSHRLLELSPLRWAASSESEEVRRILALDPYARSRSAGEP
jgi:transposase